MQPNLKLVTNLPFDIAPVSQDGRQVSLLSLAIAQPSHSATPTKQPSYLLILLVVLAHIAGAIWLKNNSDTLPIVKDVLPPMMVSLLSELPPCPVDCISMEAIAETSDVRKKEASDRARKRYNFKLFRTERENQERAQKHLERAKARKPPTLASVDTFNDLTHPTTDKHAAIAAAIARAKTTL
jgi:hypothetical protein